MLKKTVTIKTLLISLFFTVILTASLVYVIERKLRAKDEQIVSVTRGDLDEVQELYDLISTNYVNHISREKLIHGALAGMTNALDDPYSEFLSAKESKELDEQVSKDFEGIGANLQLVNHLPVIEQVPIKNSPAANAGLKAGDIILEVNGKSTEKMSLDETASSIRGEKGTEVTLLVKRGDNEFTLTLTRDVVPKDTVTGELDKKNPAIGSIQISNFRETTALEFRQQVERLRKAGAKAFVVDIRQNSGGLLNEAERVASYFLQNGQTIVQFSNADGKVSKDTASKKIDDGFKITEPAAFLVDQESASGAEILAAAVKSAGYPVIGVNTFGKGTVQNVQPIGEDSFVKLTVMKWLTPDGKWLNNKGVTPTIKADYPSYAKLPPISRKSNWRVGDTGEAIQNINDMLNALGYPTEGDQFDGRTRDAVIAIQGQNNLPATGSIDSKTASVIQDQLFKLVKANDDGYQKAIEELSKKIK